MRQGQVAGQKEPVREKEWFHFVFTDDEADEDFEEAAGEYIPYDSPMEPTDELISIKETMDAIYQADQNTYGYITSTLTEEDRNAFIELLGRADELK